MARAQRRIVYLNSAVLLCTGVLLGKTEMRRQRSIRAASIHEDVPHLLFHDSSCSLSCLSDSFHFPIRKLHVSYNAIFHVHRSRNCMRERRCVRQNTVAIKVFMVESL